MGLINFLDDVTAKIKDTAGNSLTSTSGALDVNMKSGVFSVFSDSGDVDKKALVDANRHLQVDVLS